jgi:hypothetical protein
MCIDKMKDLSPHQTYIILNDDISGGIAKDGASIILRDSGSNHYKLAKEAGNNYRVFQNNDRIDTFLPVYGLGVEPPVNEVEYINIKSQNETHFVLELKRADSPLRRIIADQYTDADPYYLKRTGLILATPVTATADVGVVGVGIGVIAGAASLCVAGFGFCMTLCLVGG